MIEITNIPPKMKRIFSGNNQATLAYNMYNIDAEITTQQGSITIINF